MRVTLRQTFPFGRFHATPWKVFPFDDPHGEWPPSPWRLVRGLLARSFQYRREGGEVSDEQQNALVTAFAGSRIAWHLPPASWRGPGLRQYQPAEFKRVPASAKEPGMMGYNTTKVMDAFWLTERGAPVEAASALWWYLDGEGWTEETLALLDACAARLTYFGRAESITELERVTASPPEIPAPNCTLEARRKQGAVPVLGLSSSATLADTLRTTDEPELAERDVPPGACWAYAERPSRPTVRPTPRMRPPRPTTQWMQFALGSLIPIYERSTVTLTQRFRGRMLKSFVLAATAGKIGELKKAPREVRKRAALLSGKDADGKALTGHYHPVYFLHFDGDQASRLCVWRREPFNDEEQTAMLKAAEYPLVLTYKESSWTANLIPLDRLVNLPPAAGELPATVWQSCTPYVPPRHVHDRRGKEKPGESVVDQITAELSSRGHAPAAIELLNEPAKWVKVHQAARERNGATNDDKRGYRIRIIFSQPQRGPIALGHSSHFGLGLFIPAEQV
jgi:CRISPR-associated protein Csb2